MIWIRGLAVALAITAAGRAAADPIVTQLITNGGFETTTLTQGGAVTGSDISGWSGGGLTYLFFPNTASIQPGIAQGGGNHFQLHSEYTDPSINSWDGTSPAGGNFIAADGDSNYNSALTQTVNGLLVGQQYQLTFYYAGGQQSTYTGPTTTHWNVTLGSGSSAVMQSTPVLSDISGGFTGWYQASFIYTASSSSELLTFLAIGTPNGVPPIALLDGVSMVAYVPEPSTIAGFGVGVLVLLAARRRRGQPATQLA